MFGRGKPWRIWLITGGLPIFKTMSHDINKESKQAGWCTGNKSFNHKKSLMFKYMVECRRRSHPS